MNFKEFLNEAYKIHKNDQVRKNVADIKQPSRIIFSGTQLVASSDFLIATTLEVLARLKSVFLCGKLPIWRPPKPQHKF